MGTIQRGTEGTGAAINMSDDLPPAPQVQKSHRRSLVDLMTLGIIADASRKKPWGLKVSTAEVSGDVLTDKVEELVMVYHDCGDFRRCY